jgi:hypothetical protein
MKITRCLALSLVLALTACGGSTYGMRPVDESPPAAVEGQVVVVFVMPTNGRDTITIVDELGGYVGQLRGHSWFAHTTTAGDHRFYGLAGAGEWLVRATGLEAGHVYFVRAEDPLLGSTRWIAGGCDASVLTGTHRTEIDPTADPASVQRQLGNVPQRTMRADEHFQRMTEPDRAARTLTGTCP